MKSAVVISFLLLSVGPISSNYHIFRRGAEKFKKPTVSALSEAKWLKYFNLSFTDRHFRINVNFEGCGCSEGNYKINGNAIILFPQNACGETCTAYFKENQLTCNLVETPESYSFLEYIKCGDIYIGNFKNQAPDGMEKDLDGTRIVISHKLIRTTKPLNIRTRPDKNARRIQYLGFQGDRYDSIPIGTEFYAIGKTKESYKVYDKLAQWYIITDVPTDGGYGYIYGEFVEEIGSWPYRE